MFIQNQLQLPAQNHIGDHYAYNQMYKNDKKNIDKNALKHSKYIDKILYDRTFGEKKKIR